ncbi:RNA methyltransferase tRNA(m5U54)methyltransferase [Pleurotus pulmonarius]|nr:RNA methyltransferase tRNA(m5U54)methyltransferase [Pleurotus pulmonarius]
MATETPTEVPAGFKLHTENTTRILLPDNNEAFLNPVQEFNRDLSIACIRVWSEELDKFKQSRWQASQERKSKAPAKKARRSEEVTETTSSIAAESTTSEPKEISEAQGSVHKEPKYHPYKFTLLEALSATGLRSIRYAKEIPLLKCVIANDLSPSAVEAIKRNVVLNGLGPSTQPEEVTPPKRPKVQINEGDACALMYNHRAENARVDAVDLDPYGTAAPFIDAAIQCVNDNGLLCITCTDLAVLATTNYPEKCYSNYGGTPVKAEYCHEAALRLVLNTVSTSAGRYGRYIEPILSLSIDFYVRIFVRVKSAPLEVKKAASKISMHYICSVCQSFYEQPLGRVVEKVHEPSGNKNYLFKTHAGPPVTDKCPECESTLHLAGPMWSGPLHDPAFVGQVLEHLEANPTHYGTATRMKGMLTVAKEELNTPFFFTPSKIASYFHCISPPLEDIASALLHAGHKISRSHAVPGSLKTTATRHEVHDIYRSWVKLHPVKMENVSPSSPARVLLAKEPSFTANFKKHPDSVTPSAKVKLVRYQQNPTANWGPAAKAVSKTKRKRDDE